MDKRKITQEELNEILNKHNAWLQTRFSNEIKGERANLVEVDLHDLDLSYVDLRAANITKGNLKGINLRNAHLDTDLSNSNLESASLICNT